MIEESNYMQMALTLAQKGKGFTSPNPMVGAVVVKAGMVVGKGYHEAAGLPHAEVMAIDDAGEDAKGATLYVTLEPCNHTGRTPPCTKKILESGIKKVMVAMEDPNPHVAGGGNLFLKSRGIEVSTGLLEDEAVKLNESFVKFVRTGRPFVCLKCAATLDGRIATSTGSSKWVTGSTSRRFVHMLRHYSDAIMVGAGTIREDNPSLTTRLENSRIKGKDPVRIILDTKLSLDRDSKVLNQLSSAETLIITGPVPSKDRIREIEKDGVRVLECPLKNGRIDLALLMDILGEIGITSLLIEGGSSVIGSAISSGIVDKVYFFYAPKILGGDDGYPISRGKGPELMDDAIRIHDIKTRRFEDDVMIEGYVYRNN